MHKSLVVKVIGKLADADAELLEQSLRCWLGLSYVLATSQN
ncbi:hypothetical protein [Nostoc sp. NZL]|nr:hypothetical protein [Nostoc sp. NZL]